jgi:hypothetical protein
VVVEETKEEEVQEVVFNIMLHSLSLHRRIQSQWVTEEVVEAPVT